MDDKRFTDVTPENFEGFEDVPTYSEAGGTSSIQPSNRPSIYERTGKAAPTEVFPRSAEHTEVAPEVPAFTGPVAGAEADTEFVEVINATSTLERQPMEVMPAPDTVVTDEVEPLPAEVHEPARRGTIDLGLLLMRLVLGGFLIARSIQVFFRLGDSAGIAGLENEFSAYAYGDILSIVLPTLALAAGVFVLLGLLGPVAAMVAVTVTGFVSLHAIASSGLGANALLWDATIWLPLILFGFSLAHQFTGPGFYAVDSGRSWARRPLASSWIFAALGAAAVALVWWFGTGINPLT